MSKRILIVDDEVAISWALKMSLSEDGYFVMVKNKAQEALEEYKKVPFDLVITDLRMPDMGGIELIQAIKNINAKTPCIIITAYPSLETTLAALRLGVKDYVSKPFNVDEMKTLIKDIIMREGPVSQALLPAEPLKAAPFPSFNKSNRPAMMVTFLKREPGKSLEKRIVIKTVLEDVYAVKEDIEYELKDFLKPDNLHSVVTVILELLINAFKFAYGESGGEVWVHYRIEKNYFTARVEDKGRGFIPPSEERKPFNTYDDVLKQEKRGLLIVRTLTDFLKIKSNKAGTVVRLGKRF